MQARTRVAREKAERKKNDREGTCLAPLARYARERTQANQRQQKAKEPNRQGAPEANFD